MPERLCAVFCHHYRAEAEMVVASSALPKLRVETLPARCGRPCLGWAELDAVRQNSQEPMVVFGGPCLAKLDAAEARLRGVTLHRFSNCLELVLTPKLLEAFLSHGAYATTPGWLEHWQGHLASQGQGQDLDQGLVRELWRESVTRLLLLDTGVGHATPAFQALSEHLGILGDIIPVGLDHMQILVEREILGARLKLQGDLAAGSLSEAQKQAADRATAMDFLGSLTESLQEADVVQRIEALFTMLFQAQQVTFIPSESLAAGSLIVNGQPYAETEGGFIVPIRASMGLAGYLHVAGLAFPKFRNHYLNLTLSMAGVCALAIQNAQTYRAVEDSRAYQRLLLNVLDVFYRPSEAGEDLGLALGHVKAYTHVDALALRLKQGEPFTYAHAVGYAPEFVQSECTNCLQVLSRDLKDPPPELEASPRGSIWINQLPPRHCLCTCAQQGFQSAAFIQLLFNGGVVGVLQLHSRQPGHFNLALIERLEGVARSIGIGLERRWVEEDLRWMNKELESRVQERTTELASSNQELRLEIVERTRAEGHLEAQSVELQARLKELHCLYALSNLFEQHAGTVEGLCHQAVQLVPQGWNHPERTSARLTLDHHEFCSTPFSESPASLSANLTINGVARGCLEVFVEAKTGTEPFLQEEYEHIRTMADLVQGLIDHLEVEEEKQKVEQQLVQSQKLEAIGTLAGGIAHDFNNALTPIITLADLSLMKLPEDSPFRKHIEIIKKSGDRAKGLVDQILLFSRQKPLDLQPLELAPLLKEGMKLIRATLPSTIEIKQELGLDGAKVLGDPTQIHQILMNLCTNAYHAMQEHGGTLVVQLSQSEICEGDGLCTLGLAPGSYVQLEVADSGQGMSREVQARIFEPFYTTKEAGKGTGMGLSVVHGIVSSYKGHISVYSEPGQGTTFRIFLPLALGEAEVQANPSGFLKIPHGTERILVVDDEESIRFALCAILENLGYRPVSVDSGPQALARLQEDPLAFDLVITDMTMPKLTGLELAQEIRRIHSEAHVVICSGFSDRLEPENLRAAGVLEFVQKPFSVAQVAQALRRELDRVV